MTGRIHFTMQGKGGVGKSYISSLIAQWHIENGKRITCVDTDPVNSTLASYKSLEALRLALCDEGSTRVSERAFDKLMVMILNDDADFIIDSGASSFLPLSNYLLENQALDLLFDAGKTVTIHPVVTGGQGFHDTLTGLQSLLVHFGDAAQIIVWINSFFGPVEAEGKRFEDMKVYQKHKDKISGLIELPRLNPDTYGHDIETMLHNKLTYHEALESKDFNIMEKQRLKVMKRAIFEQMKAVIEMTSPEMLKATSHVD